jgi:RHS repeat-associated protein
MMWRSRWIDPGGFYCLGARYYDPMAGHFLSPDPLGHSASMDLYSFCNGDPLNRFDPDGRFGKGLGAGFNDSSVSGGSSGSYMAAYYLGGVTGGFFQGFGEGGAIVANAATLGQNDSLSSYTSTLQGGVFDASRGLADFGLGTLAVAGGAWAVSTPGLYSQLYVSTVQWTYGGAAIFGGGLVAEDTTTTEETTVAAESELGEWQVVNESMSDRAAAYQTQITGAPSGWAYNVNGVNFDGISGDTLLEAKGPGYANFVNDGQFQPWFTGQQGLVNQAWNQIGAAGGAPIQWNIAEQEALPAFQNLFQQNGITGIQLIHTPVAP